MSINGIGVSDYSASWRKRKAQQDRDIPGTDFASRMADINTARANSQASNRVNGKKAINETAFGRDNYVKTKTSSEIIVKPDGSRVLMITVEIGGMQTAMSLQISEPTDMQNDISKQENDSSKASVSATSLTAVEISSSVSEG